VTRANSLNTDQVDHDTCLKVYCNKVTVGYLYTDLHVLSLAGLRLGMVKDSRLCFSFLFGGPEVMADAVSQLRL